MRYKLNNTALENLNLLIEDAKLKNTHEANVIDDSIGEQLRKVRDDKRDEQIMGLQTTIDFLRNEINELMKGTHIPSSELDRLEELEITPKEVNYE